MHDPPHTWWKRLDAALGSYGLNTTRAQRCCYEVYEDDTFENRDTVDVIPHRGCD